MIYDSGTVAMIATVTGGIGYGLHVAWSALTGWNKVKRQHDAMVAAADEAADHAADRLRQAMAAELDLRAEQVEENHKQIADLQARMEAMEKKYQAELAAAHEENAKLRSQIAELKQRNADLEKRLADLERKSK